MPLESGELELGRGVPWLARPLPSCHGAFRQNARVLLRTCGEEVDVSRTWPWRAWLLPLKAERADLHLHVYEEKSKNLATISCEPCRCNGWQHHPVSTRKYHFILPCQKEALLPLSGGGVRGERGAAGVLESKSHLLHGVIHCNGFGHLLRINGLEGGSSLLTGRQVMTLWDALCNLLQTRSVSIEDVSNRKGMLLRVLTPVSEKRTWYGCWDYHFGRGGYNISKEQWQDAVQVANQAPLDKLLEDFKGIDPLLVEVVQTYRGTGEAEVKTVGDWLARVCELSRSNLAALLFAAKEAQEHSVPAKNIPQPSTPKITSGSEQLVPRTGTCNSQAPDLSSLAAVDEKTPVVEDGAPDCNMMRPCCSPAVHQSEQCTGRLNAACACSTPEADDGKEEKPVKHMISEAASSVNTRGATNMKHEELLDQVGEANYAYCKSDDKLGMQNETSVLNGPNGHISVDIGAKPTSGNKDDPVVTTEALQLNDLMDDVMLKKAVKRKLDLEGDPSSTLPAPRRSRNCMGFSDAFPSSAPIRKPRASAPNEPPNDLVKPNIKMFNPQSLLEGPRRYSASKLSEFMCIVLGVLQTVESRWVRLQELRETLYTTAHDRVLADWVLGRISNTLFGGFAIYKTRSAIGRCNYFLFEKMDPSEMASVEGHDCLGSLGTITEEPPGPKLVAGKSLQRFELFLAQLYAWLCSQPGIVIGRSSNVMVKEICPPRERRKRPTTPGLDSAEVAMLRTRQSMDGSFVTPTLQQRRTRSYTAGGTPGWKISKRIRVNGASMHKIRQFSKDQVIDPWLHQYPSTVASCMNTLSQKGPQPGASFSAKDQVLVDLLYFYQNVLETYKPAVERDHTQKDTLALEGFPKSIQILKDTRLFVKNYDPIWMKRPLPGPQSGGAFVRIICRVNLDPTIPPGHPHRTSDGSLLKLPSFFERLPPVEPVLVTDCMSKEAVTSEIHATFKNVYGMFQNWKITHIDGLKFSEDGTFEQTAPEVNIKGCNYRPELELRHAGGIEDWEVHCSCHAEDDDGARMVACDKCGVWMHTRCVGFRDDEDLPEYFNCPSCRTDSANHGNANGNGV